MSFAASPFQARRISARRLSFRPLATWLPPVALTTLQWLTTKNNVTLVEAMLSCFLLWMPWFTYCRWQDYGGPVAPLFSMVGAAHWMSFALLLFWGPTPADPIYRVPFTEATLTAIEAMAALGVLCLGTGMRVPFHVARVRALPDLIAAPKTAVYLRFVLAVCSGAALLNDDLVYYMGGFRPVVEIFRGVLPHTVFAILLGKYLVGEADRNDRIAIAAYAALRVIIGVSAGLLGSTVSLGIVGIFVYIKTYRRLPSKALLTIIPVMLFFQAGKEAFRQVYWFGGHSGSTAEKVMFWVSTSFEVWSDALTGRSTGGGAGDLVTQSFQRVSLLDQAGNVYDKTPREVPYQLGKTYSFLLITLIPRAIWPNKPTVNDANRFYQVAYGMSTEEQLDGVSIAVGYLVESFMNFGWAGVVFVMFIMGIILGVFERMMLGRESGIVFNAIGMAILYSLTTVESQAAQYLGGLVQQIALTLVVLAPVMRFRQKHQFSVEQVRDQGDPLPA